MAATIEEAIEEIALNGVASVTVDGVTTTYMSIDDLLKARDAIASSTTAAASKPGFRLFQFKPPGMT